MLTRTILQLEKIDQQIDYTFNLAASGGSDLKVGDSIYITFFYTGACPIEVAPAGWIQLAETKVERGAGSTSYEYELTGRDYLLHIFQMRQRQVSYVTAIQIRPAGFERKVNIKPFISLQEDLLNTGAAPQETELFPGESLYKTHETPGNNL